MLFIGLGFTKWPAHAVAMTAAATSALLAWYGWHAPLPLLGSAAFEGTITALFPILWVVLSAIFIFLVCTETKAINTFRRFITAITPDRPVQVVLIAFCLGGFLESVAGFGSAVAVPAGMLIILGLDPVRATVICLVANSVPVAFGGLGIPMFALANATGLDIAILTRHVALQLALFAVLVPAVLVLMANGGWRGSRRSLLEALLIGFVFSTAQLLIAWISGPELVAVGGSLISLFAYVAYSHALRRNAPASPREPGEPSLFTATLPFIGLLVLVIATRLTPLKVLQNPPFVLSLGSDGHRMSLDLLTTPGTLLMISGFIGAIAGGMTFKRTLYLVGQAAVKIRRTAMVVLSILILAKIMTFSGMIASVARMLATAVGAYFPLLSPWLGAIGTFVTGSDTSSNILLGSLQKQTAINTGYDPAWLSAANTSGATAGKMISPQSISVGASIAGVESRQNEILRTTIVYCAGYLVLLSIVIYLGTRLGNG
jgi:lactate permease